MSKCKCTMAISLTGDGCRYCQPQEYIDRIHEQIDDNSKDSELLEARVAMLEDFVADAQVDALRALDPDYVPKEVESAMVSLLERCKTITREDDPDDIEPGAFITRKQAEAVQASREALEGEPTAIVNDSGVLEWYPPYNRPPAGTKLYTHPASEATGDDQAKADERISVHEYTARMSLEALKFYTEWMQRNDCGEPEPIEHFYAMQAIEEIESLLPEPPKQEQSQ